MEGGKEGRDEWVGMRWIEKKKRKEKGREER